MTHNNRSLPDVDRLMSTLQQLDKHPVPQARTLFDRANEISIGRAPGRLDVMGGIADYSGSLVLQLPVQEATLAALQKRADCLLTIVSLGTDRSGENGIVQMSLDDFVAETGPVDYATVRERFRHDSAKSWVAYIAGAFLVLMRERNIQFDQGANILIQSDVPEGKGVSSSAAVEVATMSAIADAYNIDIAPREMALLCQMVENLVVGAPCGVMDQMTSVCGEANQLLALLCQPAEILEPVTIPPELAVWGVDSGIRHAVSGADYGSVRIGAFMGYRMLLEMADVARADVPSAEISDTRWGGYLANCTPSEFLHEFGARLPETMTGSTFLKRYDGTTDTVTQIEPERIYAVRQPTSHPIHEHFRVKAFARLLEGDAMANAELLGECMYQSHASYSACGLGSDGTDQLVQLARAAGPTAGIFGAKITGGGSGGTVAILARSDATEAVHAIAEQYEERTGLSPHIFQNSSDGAAQFGVRRYTN